MILLQCHTDMLHTITLFVLFSGIPMHSECRNEVNQELSHLRQIYNTTSRHIKEKSKRSSYNQKLLT